MLDVSATGLKDSIAKYETHDDFKQAVQLADKLLVVLFVSRDAPSSMKFAPEFSKLEKGKSDTAMFGFVTAETNTDTCTELEISAYPTVVIYKNTNQVAKLEKPSVQ